MHHGGKDQPKKTCASGMTNVAHSFTEGTASGAILGFTMFLNDMPTCNMLGSDLQLQKIILKLRTLNKDVAPFGESWLIPTSYFLQKKIRKEQKNMLKKLN